MLVAFTVYVPAVLGAVYRPVEETVPPLADQVTEVLLDPVTVAVNCWMPPVESEAEVGEMLTETTGGAVTATDAEADFVWSAVLVAVTVYVPAVLGAVYRPVEETVPPLADQVTAVLLEPVMVAVNCRVPPVESEAEVGEMLTETIGAVTVIDAEADFGLTLTVVAVTV